MADAEQKNARPKTALAMRKANPWGPLRADTDTAVIRAGATIRQCTFGVTNPRVWRWRHESLGRRVRAPRQPSFAARCKRIFARFWKTKRLQGADRVCGTAARARDSLAATGARHVLRGGEREGRRCHASRGQRVDSSVICATVGRVCILPPRRSFAPRLCRHRPGVRPACSGNAARCSMQHIEKKKPPLFRGADHGSELYDGAAHVESQRS